MQFPYKQLIAAVAMSGIASLALAQSVRFLEPVDGATVGSPFKVRFAVDGMEVKPAGEMAANTGHHHLLINAEPVKQGESVPFDDQHLHFGKGQTEAEVKLAPGTYVLTMQFANGAHQSYGAPMSKSIKITVK
ncbi:MAG: DUF4399 domain-containing protein [Pseudomonadota bacterium]|nr:DUF4399 domain-containing protein [Pseudomonadota bacterium]